MAAAAAPSGNDGGADVSASQPHESLKQLQLAGLECSGVLCAIYDTSLYRSPASHFLVWTLTDLAHTRSTVVATAAIGASSAAETKAMYQRMLVVIQEVSNNEITIRANRFDGEHHGLYEHADVPQGLLSTLPQLIATSHQIVHATIKALRQERPKGKLPKAENMRVKAALLEAFQHSFASPEPASVAFRPDGAPFMPPAVGITAESESLTEAMLVLSHLAKKPSTLPWLEALLPGPPAQEQQPASAEQQPASAHRQPASAEQQPASAEQQPASAHRQPASGEQQPASAVQQPASAHRQPASGEQQPASAEQQPASAHRQPASAEQQPASAHRQPASAEQQPALGEQQPAFAEQQPASGEQQPASQDQSVRDQADEQPRTILSIDESRAAALVRLQQMVFWESKTSDSQAREMKLDIQEYQRTRARIINQAVHAATARMCDQPEKPHKRRRKNPKPTTLDTQQSYSGPSIPPHQAACTPSSPAAQSLTPAQEQQDVRRQQEQLVWDQRLEELHQLRQSGRPAESDSPGTSGYISAQTLNTFAKLKDMAEDPKTQPAAMTPMLGSMFAKQQLHEQAMQDQHFNGRMYVPVRDPSTNYTVSHVEDPPHKMKNALQWIVGQHASTPENISAVFVSKESYLEAAKTDPALSHIVHILSGVTDDQHVPSAREFFSNQRFQLVLLAMGKYREAVFNVVMSGFYEAFDCRGEPNSQCASQPCRRSSP